MALQTAPDGLERITQKARNEALARVAEFENTLLHLPREDRLAQMVGFCRAAYADAAEEAAAYKLAREQAAWSSYERAIGREVDPA